MKIVHLCLASPYIDNYSYQENMLPKYHKLMGHEVAVIASMVSFDKNGEACLLDTAGEYFCPDGYKITRLKYKKRFNLFNRILRRYENTYNSIEKENPDVIFIHSSQFWDIRQVVKYVKNYKGVKVLVDNHADFINSATNWISRNILHGIIWRYFTGVIEPYAEKFYGVTPLRCDFLKDVYRVSGSKIELLVMGADDEKINMHQRKEIRQRIRSMHNISEKDFVIISGGKIDVKKNIHLLMRAVLESGNTHLKLIIFGTSNQQMKPVIDNLSRSEKIVNIGWIDSCEAYDYFMASDLAVFPGSHSVLWEQSVGTGIPGVFRYWKGMDHVNLGGNCRFLYKDSVSEIRETIEEIVNDPDEFSKMKKISEDLGIPGFSYREISRRALEY